MAQRLRFIDFVTSGIAEEIGLCQGDRPRLARVANTAERRLLLAKESGDEGWWGTWAEMRFNVLQSAPSIVTPREVARLEAIAICRRPVPIRNLFWDYQQFGNRQLLKQFVQAINTNTGSITNIFGNCFGLMQARSRNQVPTFSQVSNPPQLIRVYTTNAADSGARVLLQGLDPANNVIFTLDNAVNTTGQYVTLMNPFVTATLPMNLITGIQKDVTLGQIQVFQVDPTTGAQVLLHTMEPSETTGWYRRYHLDQLPVNCCNDPNSSLCPPVNGQPVVQVSAIAKLDHIPVSADTDYFVIQNLDALMEEARAVRYLPMDTTEAKQFVANHHKNAIGLLNGELAHFLGIDEPTVNFKPFGSAHLARQRIGTMI